MAQIDARPLLDGKGEQYYPFTHVSCVDGLPDNLEDFDAGNIESDLKHLQEIINSIPAFGSTGWMDIAYLSGTTAYDSASRPQVQLMTIGDVRFMSLRGSFKGLTKDQQTIGQIPSSIRWAVTKNVYFTQSMSSSGGKSQYSTMKMSTDGIISLEETTLDAVTTGTWLAVDWTFML